MKILNAWHHMFIKLEIMLYSKTGNPWNCCLKFLLNRSVTGNRVIYQLWAIISYESFFTFVEKIRVWDGIFKWDQKHLDKKRKFCNIHFHCLVPNLVISSENVKIKYLANSNKFSLRKFTWSHIRFGDQNTWKIQVRPILVTYN